MLPLTDKLTTGRHALGLEFSPASPNLLAIIANDNYAISGGGELAVLSTHYGPQQGNTSPGPHFTGRADQFLHNDALCSLAWCSHSPRLLATGTRSGRLLLWDIAQQAKTPVYEGSGEQGAGQEMSTIACSPVHHTLITGSWDGTIMTFDPVHGKFGMTVDKMNTLVYDVRYSCHEHNTFAVASGDGCVRVYQSGVAGLVLPAHVNTDALSCDWSATQPHLLATAGSDAAVYVWDLRYVAQPMVVVQGHNKAVNKVRFSPHVPSTLATASYDFTTRVWQDDGTSLTSTSHTGFVMGVAWNHSMAGVLADCSWDGSIALYVT